MHHPVAVPVSVDESADQIKALPGTATAALDQLEVKGRAAKTGYARTEFGDGWLRQGACDMRNIILNRDLKTLSLTMHAKCSQVR